VLATPVVALAVSLVAWSTAASAHSVTGIEANCSQVTVHFEDFPDAGVMVHIAATVAGQPTIATDVLVKNAMSATLDISAATSALFGASADVDLDVTWTFDGPQHVHDKVYVTCGSPTTTTTVGGQGTTSTTVGGQGTTTTTLPGGTTTTIGQGTTSTTVGGQGTTTTTLPGGTTTTIGQGTTSTTVGGQGTTTTTVGGGTTTTTVGGQSATTTTVPGNTETNNEVESNGSPNSASVLGESTTAGTGSLPFTGSATPTLAGTGLGLLTVGATLLVAKRRALW